MDKDRLHEIIKEKEPNICQIAAYINNAPVYCDEWNGYKREDAVHVMSVTKSVMAILLGIAIDKGLVHSVEDKVLDYFPEYTVKRGEKTIFDVTIGHLITMRAPYKGQSVDPWTKVCSSGNWTYTSLDFLGGKNGITDEFRYTTVCLHILSGILYKATGMKTVDYANRYLFVPLGIAEHRNFYAKSAEEHKAFTLNKKPIGHIWFADPEGLGTPGYGLSMSAVDMAKIGQLCLNGGEWNGRRIVSESWINQMLTPRDVDNEWFRGMSYGYMWWIIDKEENIYAAIGNSGNVIYVNPDRNLVIGLTSYFKPTVYDRIDFIRDCIEPYLCAENWAEAYILSALI